LLFVLQRAGQSWLAAGGYDPSLSERCAPESIKEFLTRHFHLHRRTSSTLFCQKPDTLNFRLSQIKRGKKWRLQKSGDDVFQRTTMDLIFN
jgi:hypothetical protein